VRCEISGAYLLERELLNARAVPSFPHEIVVELFRNSSQLAQEILESFDYRIEGTISTEAGPTDLSEVVPRMLYADYVMVSRDQSQQPTRAVVVEIQRSLDERKFWTWPAYWSSARIKFECPTVLLVIALTEEVAEWARAYKAEFPFPFFVISPGNTPRVIDPKLAQRRPALAVLSALAHPELEVAELAAEAIRQLPSDQFRLYFDAILAELPESIRPALETSVQGYQYRSEFARRYVAEGRQEGLQEGRQAGLQEGLQEGLQNAALAIARAKLGELSAEEQAAVRAVRGEAALTALISRLTQAPGAEELRAILSTL
jgi:hypothetical protein